MRIEEEIAILVEEIKRLGMRDSNDKFRVSFGLLVKDDRVANLRN